MNGAYKDEGSRIGQLMYDFRCVEADDMHNKILADKVRYYKETEGGREVMCKLMENMRNEAVNARNTEIALGMIADGKLSVELIAKYSGLTVDEVQELIDKKSA